MAKINIAELLRDCPKGMELDCVVYDNLTFDYINEEQGRIYCKVEGRDTVWFTIYGCVNHSKSSKCVIFPKGKTTWEGFHRPFKDGDIVVYDNPHRNNLQVFVFKNKEGNNTLSSCYLMLDGDELVLEEGMYYITRLATEEEKQKLFDAIKANGYKWNAETRTLELLFKPRFKVGDRIKDKDGYIVKITEVNEEDEGYEYESVIAKGTGCVVFSQEDEWELVPNKFDLNTLVPFESRVLVRDKNTEKWKSNFWGFYDIDSAMNYPYECCGSSFTQCIPYESNEHLLGKTDDCDEYYKTWED